MNFQEIKNKFCIVGRTSVSHLMTSLHSSPLTSNSTSEKKSPHPFQWVAEELFSIPGIVAAQVHRIIICFHMSQKSSFFMVLVCFSFMNLNYNCFLLSLSLFLQSFLRDCTFRVRVVTAFSSHPFSQDGVW